jgi:hypothetical protein
MFLESYIFGERVIGWVRGGGGVRNISSPLRGVLNIFRRFWGGGAKFYGKILEYPPPPPAHILYDRSLIA